MFSIKWLGSKQTRKQRKFRMNAPLHIRHQMMSANLSEELGKKYNRRNFPVRKGDKVKVIGGKFDKKEGKITDVDLKKMKVAVENIQIQKKDGTKVNVYIPTSKLEILEMNLDDKKRLDALNRKNKVEEKNPEKAEKKEEKTGGKK